MTGIAFEPVQSRSRVISTISMAYEFNLEERAGWVLIYFDEAGRSVAFHVHVQ